MIDRRRWIDRIHRQSMNWRRRIVEEKGEREEREGEEEDDGRRERVPINRTKLQIDRAINAV